MPQLRAVFISPIVPASTGNGLAMRMGLFVEALSRIARVDVIVVPVAGESKDEISFLRIGTSPDIYPMQRSAAILQEGYFIF